MDVGFLGMGIMGRPMATNLVNAGYPVRIWNRTRSRCDAVHAAGAIVCASPADVARQSEIVIVCVSDTPDVEAVLFGPDGAAEGLAPGGVVVDMSTISPLATEDFAQRLSAQGCAMLDAPVSGGDVGAKAGTLAIMVGGEAKTFARCMPLFEVLGKTVKHVGPNGAGQKTKLVNQVLVALNLLATAEAMRLIAHGGLDAEAVHGVVTRGAAGSWQLEHLGPRMLAGDFEPGFTIRLLRKDLRLAREWLEALGLVSPGAALTYELFDRAVARGLGDLGTQGLYRLLEEAGGEGSA